MRSWGKGKGMLQGYGYSSIAVGKISVLGQGQYLRRALHGPWRLLELGLGPGLGLGLKQSKIRVRTRVRDRGRGLRAGGAS